MATNRRPGQNRQTPARRAKVAGLRKRERATPEEKTSGAEADDTAASSTAESAANGAGPEPEKPAAEQVTGTPDAKSGGEAEPEAEAGEATEPEAEAGEATDGDAVEAAAEDVAEPADIGDKETAETAVPRSKTAQDAGTTDDEAASRQDDVGEPSEAEARSYGPERGWMIWGAAAVLVVLAVVLAVGNYLVRSTGPMANEALVDSAVTSEVNGQVKTAVETLFSYDFNDTAKTENAAKNLLVGDAVAKYNDLFAVVRQQAPAQQLIVTTTVKNSAVTRLEGDRAEVLVFADQHAMRANTGESNIGPAQLTLSAEKHDGQWKIIAITLR